VVLFFFFGVGGVCFFFFFGFFFFFFFLDDFFLASPEKAETLPTLFHGGAYTRDPPLLPSLLKQFLVVFRSCVVEHTLPCTRTVLRFVLHVDNPPYYLFPRRAIAASL